jgi:hypothetical protein
MLQPGTEKPSAHRQTARARPEKKGISAFFPRDPLDGSQPSLIYFSETPLFRLERAPGTYAHLLKKKDLQHIGPIVNYFINNSGNVAFLSGEAVANLYLHGKRKYKTIGILAILTDRDTDKYSCIMNNIISANDGSFSLGLKYRVRKNRGEGSFKEIADHRYIIEPRLEGPEKLLYLFRPASVELDLTTQERFSAAFGVELR